MNILIYKYALQPTQSQWRAFRRAARSARQTWNQCVQFERDAWKDFRFGRFATVVRELGAIVDQKKVVGMAVASARKLAAKEGITEAEALQRRRREMVSDWAKWRSVLATHYATERQQAISIKRGSALAGGVRQAVYIKFIEAHKGGKSRCRFKSARDNIALQFQVTGKGSRLISDGHVDLSLIGGQRCKAVAFVEHRPIPEGAEIQQVAVKIEGPRAYLVLFLKVTDATYAKNYPAMPGVVLGVDPGRKTALTVANPDGTHHQEIQPPLFRDRRHLKRLARAQRTLDRRLRRNNPEAFAPDGTWIKGRRASVISRNMLKTRRRISEMQRHVADARRDAYHNASGRLLAEADVVGVGMWKPRGVAPGEGQARRAQLRKDYDNAIGLFKQLLAEKAKRSTTPKKVLAINEAHTTRTCPHCGAETGPSGLDGLSVREWTCAQCGRGVLRDFAAAMQIARRTVAEAYPVNGGASQTQPVRATARKRKTTKAKAPSRRNQRSRGPETEMSNAAASAPLPAQPTGGARVSEEVVGAVVGNSEAPETAGNPPQGDARSQAVHSTPISRQDATDGVAPTG